MLHHDRFPANGPHDWSSILRIPAEEEAHTTNDASSFNFQGDFPRLGEIPTVREKTMIEELFSFDGPPDAMVSVGGQDYYYFSGEGYLGLQANPEVLAATCEAVLRYGTSLGSIRRRFTPAPLFDVERQTADIYGTASAMYLVSESVAMEQLLGSVSETFDAIFVDELTSDANFAAITRACGPQIHPIVFRHRDMDHLATLLRKHLSARERPLVVTDGVFNVTGEIAPLPDLYEILVEYPNSALLIDDSDALGVIGEKGRGTLEYYDYASREVNQTRLDIDGDPTFGIGDLESWDSNEPDFSDEGLGVQDSGFPGDFGTGDEELPETDELPHKDGKRSLPVRTYLIASLSRAVGGFGAVVPGSDRFIDRIKRKNTNYGPLPPTPLAMATYKGLQLSFHHDLIRHRLWDNVFYFKTELEKLGVASEPNMVPIISLRTGSDGNMRRIQRELIADQILVSFLQQMNAQRREGSLRIALFATHEREMLNIFLGALKEIL